MTAAALPHAAARAQARRRSRSRVARTPVGKRAFDLLAVVGTAPLWMPVAVAIALAVGLTSPGPVLFAQHRYTRGGRRFVLLKFRTMAAAAPLDPVADPEWSYAHKLRRDPRVTPVGRWLRRASLDELPQLWNVFVGEMSLVGPRPLPVAERGDYGRAFARYCRVTPGLTGLWQVSGRSDLPYEAKARLDTRYARNRSWRLDAWILLRTFRAVATGRGAY
ncbi:sugar transferase [Phycisphaera mikurensis]|uniref:Putative glycosyltransferase n=1 Tax=Phycisphaera mikurensis (strain NBRC 102666 / KCTC 22515 / FYK2301M01) TaxID=1142394 RepID=I0IIV4_PHYMF|nr:sugar transferase [Phycisphaera mikurensis]MBB6443357.1 lipopolysaccharide/colanic/teichoic acid biosynthesis glycosyltransferase [Phycisphaera mikurensis]BAM05192.1 putative glycosyltransferase [Phycisphaera mikurensis NBRC 102666]